MIKLTEADRLLKNTYLYLVNDKKCTKKATLQSKRIICLKCGKSDKPLRKIENGYICNDCLKELQGESI